MRKAVVEGSIQIKEGSGRRYWVRANPSPSSGSATGGKTRKRAKARFLEPYHLSDGRRAVLVDLLDAGGVGDDEGRVLFAAAIEYDIAAYRQSVPAEPDPVAMPAAPAQPDPDPSLEAEKRLADLLHAFGETAAVLVGAMSELGPAARERLAAQLKAADAFKRDYTNEYLDVLGAELGRVAEAARSIPRASAPVAPAAPQPPPLSAGAQRFLRRVARVYEECLEAKAADNATFRAVLELVAVEAGIGLLVDSGSMAAILDGA